MRWLQRCVVAALLAGCAARAQGTFENPVLWDDLADVDVLRVGDTFYYSASNMHYSPGAPILQSKDLVHWEYVGHSVPRLDFGAKYDLPPGGERGYVRGTWASFLGYRQSEKKFYWGGCIDFKKTYLYSAPAAAGPWQRHAVLDTCYYDAGLLVDDDDTMYVAYGNTTLHVAQLSRDGTKEVRSAVVFQTPPEVKTLEGSRFYKRGGAYYLWTTKPANGQYVLRSTAGPWGPYTLHEVLLDTKGPIAGGGTPHQGGLVQTARGDWWYLAFQDAYPGGRVPVLAPVTWDKDGWPELHLRDNAWPKTLPYPAGVVPGAAASRVWTDGFTAKALRPEWEWNHNPDDAQWSAGDGLMLHTATVTDDLYSARNTLTHRIRGPVSTATVEMDAGAMRDGDRAGLAMFRDRSAWVGVVKDAGGLRVVMTNGIEMKLPRWETTSTGTEAASAPLAGTRVWLRVRADVRPGAEREAVFSYSTDGKEFRALGPAFRLNADWPFFMGYRFGLFSYATKELGGAARFRSFAMETP